MFNGLEGGKNFTLHLLRNNVEVASGPIILTNLPIVEIRVLNDNNTTYVQGTLRINNPLDASSNKLVLAKFRHRGATALTYPKISFNIKLIQEDGSDLDSTILGIRPENSWILDAMAIDRIRMRNRVCFDIWNSYSTTPDTTNYNNRNGTKGQFVEVLINGSYNGLYCISDKIDRKLLDLKKVKYNEDSTAITVRGVLYKSNSWDNTSLNISNMVESSMDTTVWNNWELEYPDDYPSSEAWMPLKELYELCSDNTAFLNGFSTSFFEDNVVDYHLFILALNVEDNGNKNEFLSTHNITKSKQFLITPWDLDTSLGGYYDGRYYDGTYATTTVADHRINQNNPFLMAWTTNIDNYRNLMANRWKRLRNRALSQDSINAELEKYASLFLQCGAWQREVERWPTGCPIVTDLNKEIKYIEAWYANRLVGMNDYLNPYITDIQSAPNQVKDSETIYNLNGTLVNGHNPPSKGIYIVNGKKVYIR